MKKVLIIRNDEYSKELESFLKEQKDCSPIIVDSVDEGLGKLYESENLEVVLINVESSGLSGLDALKRIKRERSKVIVIMIRAGVQTARKAMCLGAWDALSEDSTKEHIYEVLDEAFERLSIRKEASSISKKDKKRLKEQYPLIGEDAAMFELNKTIGRVANDKVSVLIEGETGSGKELVAQLIHEESERTKEFVPIDSGALSDALLESELFGHKAGAFTSAKEDKHGGFRSADGGTLFLDEIGNMSQKLQIKLLRVLQEQKVRPVGDDKAYKVDVRVICATNQKLDEMVAQEKFRPDLFHRLCGYRITLPPLRDRTKEDIELLSAHFLQRIEEERDKPLYGISEEVMKLFQKYNWPGNVRELENCLKSATANSQNEVILPKDLPLTIQKYKRDKGSKEDTPVMQSSETSETPVYKNLFDLPVVVFCQFISDAEPEVTDLQIAEWAVEFSDDGRYRASKAKRKIYDWRVDWNKTWLTPSGFLERTKEVVDTTVSQLSNRHRKGSELIEEAEPISIEKRTLKGSLTAVLHEIVKGHGGNREKAAKELDIPMQQLEKRLSYIVKEKEYDGDSEKAANALGISVQQLETWLLYWTKTDRDDEKNALHTKIKPSKLSDREKCRSFRVEHIRRLRTNSVISFVSESFSRIQWRDKSPGAQMQTVHLALKTLSKRLEGEHGYIYFGGMTFSQIERNIYRRASYLYENPTEAAEALNVSLRTFRKYWPKEKPFPNHHTLFPG